MKANKVTLIAQAIGMYVMHLPLYILFVIELIPVENEMLAKGLLTATLILMVPVFLLCIANIVISVICDKKYPFTKAYRREKLYAEDKAILKSETDPSKTVMGVKLALIPWYIMNFVMCLAIVGAFFNPFLMIGIPVAIAFFAGTTYFCMLATSLPDVGFYLRRIVIKKDEKITASRVLTVILLFIFCLDVIGSILFRLQNKKKLHSNTEASIPENK